MNIYTNGLRFSSSRMSYPYNSKQCLSLIIIFWTLCKLFTKISLIWPKHWATWGEVWGEVRGEVRGEVWGKRWGEVRGEVWGKRWGKRWGEFRGEVWGKIWGEVRGEVWGKRCGERLEERCGVRGLGRGYWWVRTRSYEQFAKSSLICPKNLAAWGEILKF